ncbi:MAG: CPBP family intramembrane glutamic endopeptidase [Bacteroidota bacterium]
MRNSTLPVLAVLLAIAISATMDFTGYTLFSALPLVVIIALFWLLLRLSKKEIGLKFGPLKYYGIALLYPLLVLGATGLIAYIYGDFSVKEINIKNELLNLGVGLVIGPIMLMLTEEGFFRGWLWGAFRKARFSPNQTLYITSGCFVLWHISAVTCGSDFSLPITQVPVYLTNALFLGLIWGTMRMASGSIIAPAFCHAVWNTFAYGLFGFGEKTGILGVSNTALLGPEVGYLGILLNGLFFLWLWKVTKKSRAETS